MVMVFVGYAIDEDFESVGSVLDDDSVSPGLQPADDTKRPARINPKVYFNSGRKRFISKWLDCN